MGYGGGLLGAVARQIMDDFDNKQQESIMIEIKRVTKGEFIAFINGVASEYTITNGSMGVSGNGRNEYLITVGGTIKQTGLTLAKAKKLVTHWATKAATTQFEDTSAWVPAEDETAWMAADAALIAAHKAKQGK